MNAYATSTSTTTSATIATIATATTGATDVTTSGSSRGESGESFTQTFHPPPIRTHLTSTIASAAMTGNTTTIASTNGAHHTNGSGGPIINATQLVHSSTHRNTQPTIFTNTVHCSVWDDEDIPNTSTNTITNNTAHNTLYNTKSHHTNTQTASIRNHGTNTTTQPNTYSDPYQNTCSDTSNTVGTMLTQAEVRRAFRDVNRSVHNLNTTTANTAKRPPIALSALHHSGGSANSVNSNNSNSSGSSNNSSNSNSTNGAARNQVPELFDITDSNTQNTAVTSIHTQHNFGTSGSSARTVQHTSSVHGIALPTTNINATSIQATAGVVRNRSSGKNVFTQMSQAGNKMAFDDLLD